MTSEDLTRRAGIGVVQPAHDGRGKRKRPGSESPRPATRAAEAHPWEGTRAVPAARGNLGELTGHPIIIQAYVDCNYFSSFLHFPQKPLLFLW